MSPLYLYNGKLLVKDGALATNENCCCVECCGTQPAITINFGPDATGGFAFPYGQVVVPFVGFDRHLPYSLDIGCTLVWSTGNGLTIMIVSNAIGIIQSINMVDSRPGGHNTTWTHITGGVTPDCLPCSGNIIDRTFDNWSNNPWNARAFGDWHEGEYGKIVENTYLEVKTVAPTPANMGNYTACVGYRFKISGYHKYQNPNNLSDAEYQQAFAGQPAPWTGGPVNGAPAIVSPTPIPGPGVPNGLGDKVIANWGISTANHIYRATYVPAANIQLWAWINDSIYTDNAEREPYYISAWQRFPRLTI